MQKDAVNVVPISFKRSNDVSGTYMMVSPFREIPVDATTCISYEEAILFDWLICYIEDER